MAMGHSPTLPMPEPMLKQLRNWWPKVKNPDGCWEWTGATRGGYPEVGIGDKTYRAHRLFFSWFKWPVPEDLTIDHLCKNRLCVNPDHMEAVPHEVNVSRAVKRAYCKRGHAQTPENRYSYTAVREDGVKKVMSRCRLCLRMKRAVPPR